MHNIVNKYTQVKNKIKFSAIVLMIMFGFTHSITVQHADSSFYNDQHAHWIKELSGTWVVKMTAQPMPQEKPVIIEGIIAHRSMLNNFTLYEEMIPLAGSKIPDFKRISYLSY